MKVIELLIFMYESALMNDVLIRDSDGNIFNIKSVTEENGNVYFTLGINVLKHETGIEPLPQK